MAFTDGQMMTASRLAQELALEFDVPEVVERLTDKDKQRAALRAGGLPVPAWWMLPPGAGRTVIDRIASEATFPVVVKPSRGSASSFTYLVASAGELHSVVADPDNGIGQAAFIVEEFIPGTSREIDSDVADFVSVESVVSHGVISHLAICGKFTLEPPFRGTGGFLPVDLPADEVDDLLDVTTPRVARPRHDDRVLAHRAQVVAPGARVVEVNGRIGGNIPTFIEGSTGVSLPHLAVDVALGRPFAQRGLLPTRSHHVPGPRPTSHVGPASSSTFPAWTSSGKCPAWMRSPCASRSTRPSNWRVGSDRLIFLVSAHATDHREMLALRSRILSTIRTTFK